MAPLLRAFVGYAALILIVRLASRRPGKQITPFEFVLIFFMGGLTLTAMVGNDASFTNAACTILGLGIAHAMVSSARAKWPRFARLVDGTPLFILERGVWHTEVTRRMRVQADDVVAAARDHGMKTLDEVGAAILERNGEITVIAKGPYAPSWKEPRS